MMLLASETTLKISEITNKKNWCSRHLLTNNFYFIFSFGKMESFICVYL